MKNIAIFIPSLMPGGAEKQATLLATMLDKSYNVDIYLLYGDTNIAPQNEELLNKSNVKVIRMTGSIISKIFQLKRSLKRRKTDVLLNYLTSCNVIGAIAGRLAGVQKIYGGIRNARIEWSKMIAEKIIHNHLATGTIFNCYSGAEYFTSKGFKKNRNIVIPNCFLNIERPIQRNDREIKHIVTAGRFVPQKDYKTMIASIAGLKKIRQDFVIDIIGYGADEDNIRGWIDEYNVNENVNIFIKPNNVQDIIRDADIYISTSLFEGTSNSIMEALNWSLPVVATNVGDNNRLVINEVNGMLHDIGDSKGITESLNMLIDSSEMRNKYGCESNRILKDNYTTTIFEKRYTSLIESC